MSARLLVLVIFVSATVAGATHAADTIDARVRAGLEATGDVWVGQQIGLTVDILSTGFTFAKQRIRLPQVPGALVLEDAVTTINLNERIDGVTWQVLRYRYPMFVQRAGKIEVPPIEVAFEVSAGFGSTAVAFEQITEGLSLTVLRPPGVTALQNLVTTPQFTLDVATTPLAEVPRVGDALTRTITRSAGGVSGMAFAPLPIPEINGVAVYPDTPLIDDSSNRGELRGKRVDAITFVLQAPGEVTLPGIDFQWWDPIAANLNLTSVPALTLNVSANPSLTQTTESGFETDTHSFSWLHAVFAAVFALLGWSAIRLLPVVKIWLNARAQARALTAATRFNQLQQACRKNDTGLAYNAYLRWIAAEQELSTAVVESAALKSEREKVQLALISSDRNWRGQALARAAHLARQQKQRNTADANTHALAAMNPEKAADSTSPQV